MLHRPLKLLSTHYASYSLLTTHYARRTTTTTYQLHSSLKLRTTHYSLRTTHYSLRTTHHHHLPAPQLLEAVCSERAVAQVEEADGLDVR